MLRRAVAPLSGESMDTTAQAIHPWLWLGFLVDQGLRCCLWCCCRASWSSPKPRKPKSKMAGGKKLQWCAWCAVPWQLGSIMIYPKNLMIFGNMETCHNFINQWQMLNTQWFLPAISQKLWLGWSWPAEIPVEAATKSQGTGSRIQSHCSVWSFLADDQWLTKWIFQHFEWIMIQSDSFFKCRTRARRGYEDHDDL